MGRFFILKFTNYDLGTRDIIKLIKYFKGVYYIGRTDRTASYEYSMA